ncbi:NAD-dependent epimerase/dehydratase family protein [Azospirillum sp.]|uniref:NAD-dependent epimerase/dehydratase family protein n=1 Tax=Azospirillum sp. TaxID=34012 RepID=UPI002D30D8A5|nr:NAD-dependent epimerase/dehydratase family protein [Azospirillum sp.]HYD64578.1 NAD-dependent epimerase/dehydratase family protein [Azospirillum sp.]
MTIVVTGAAGFIGAHLTRALLARGERVVGVDSLNDYYPVTLKEARLGLFRDDPAFTFVRADIADPDAIGGLFTRLEARGQPITGIAHLAAQAGVRYSLTNPYAYVQANVMGQVVMLEAARRLSHLRHLVYASSSSVYGANTKLPFAEDDRVDRPVSLYAASKRSAELISHTYSQLYGLPATGLRFFTVYGPWGRPDMAPWLFTEAITRGEPIRLFNNGRMRRDFTYIGDIVAGVTAALDRPPEPDADGVRHRVYNLGNHQAEELGRFVAILEQAIGRPAIRRLEPMQPGDVEATFADIEASRRDLGFAPGTSLEDGLPRFVSWYKGYHGLA